MAIPTVTHTTSAHPAQWRVGDVIQELYEVRGLLGEGGMGKVYRMRHLGWNLDLAVKSPRSDVLTKEGGGENFVREAETWVNLGLHPHIVSCYYVRTIAETPCVFAECLEGGSLFDWIHTKRLYEGGAEVALERILDVSIQFAWGLHYAHGQGVVHQDVKSGNVMLTPGGAVKVTDFGLARARAAAGEVSWQSSEPGKSVVVPGAGLMTPAYASPEQAQAQPLTRKTDIWSWGASLLEMFAGGLFWTRGEFVGESLEEYLEDWNGADGLPRMPGDVAELLRQCFDAERARRPASMEEVADRLRAVYARVSGREYPREEPHGGQGSADNLNNRALSYLDLGKEAEAEAAWQAALAADLKHPETTYNLGVLRWRRGDVSDEELIRQLESVRTLHGSQWLDEYLLALVHLERGDADAATALLQDAARQAPESVEVRKALRLANRSGSAHERAQKTIVESGGALASVFVKPDGREALSVNAGGVVERWDVETGRRLGVFDNRAPRYGNLVPAEFASFSDEGDAVLLGGGNHQTRIWGTTSGACLHKLDLTFIERVLTWWWRKNNYRSTKEIIISGVKWTLFIFYFQSVLMFPIVFLLRQVSSEDAAVVIFALGSPLLIWLHFKMKKWARAQYIRRRGHLRFITVGALSGDGKRVFSCSADERMDYEELTCWDVETGRRIHKLEERTTANGVASQEAPVKDKWIWVYYLILAVVFYFAQGIALMYLIYKYVTRNRDAETPLTPEEGAVSCLALDASGRYGVTGATDGVVKLYDMQSGQRLQTFKGHGSKVNAVCLSDDGQYVMSGGEDGSVRLWDIGRGNFALTLDGHEGSVTCVSFDRDGRHAVSAGQDRVVRLWETSTGCCLRTYAGHEGVVTSAGISDVKGLIASAGEDGTLRLWRVPREGGEEFPLQVSRVRAAEDVIETEGRAGGLLKRVDEAIRAREFADALRLAGETRRTPGFERAKQTRDLWESLSLHCRRVGLRGAWLVRTFGAQGVNVSCAGLSGDGGVAVSGSDSAAGGEKTLRLWDVATGHCLTDIALPEAVTAVCISSDGLHAMTGSADGSPRLWDVRTGKHLRTFWGHIGVVNSVCLSDDGRYAVSCGADRSLRLWEVATGVCLRTIMSRDSGPLRAVSISHCCRYALTGGASGELRLWELSTGRCVIKIDAHARLINTVCLSSDGSRALTGGDDGSLQLWELKAGTCLRTFQGHEGALVSACLTGDGRFALSGGADGRLRLWEVESGNCVHVLEGHAGGVTSVSVSASGRYALSGGQDKSLRLWELDWELEALRSADWDDAAQPHLENFLYLHMPAAGELPADRDALPAEVESALTRAGQPVWDEQDFRSLMRRLQCAGYGWLRHEGVRDKLLEMSAVGGEALGHSTGRAWAFVSDLLNYYRRHKYGVRTFSLLLVLVAACIAALYVSLTFFYHLRNDAKTTNARAANANSASAALKADAFNAERWQRYSVGDTNVSLELPAPLTRHGVEIPDAASLVKKLDVFLSYTDRIDFFTEVRHIVLDKSLRPTPQEGFDAWKNDLEARGITNSKLETRPSGSSALRLSGWFDVQGHSRLVDGLVVTNGSEVLMVLAVRNKTWNESKDSQSEEAARRIIDSIKY